MVIYTVSCIQKDYVSGRKFKQAIASFADRAKAEDLCDALTSDCLETTANSVPLYIAGFEVEGTYLDPDIVAADNQVRIGPALTLVRHRQDADFERLRLNESMQGSENAAHAAPAEDRPISDGHADNASGHVRKDQNQSAGNSNGSGVASNTSAERMAKEAREQRERQLAKEEQKKKKEAERQNEAKNSQGPMSFDPDIDTLNMDAPIMGSFGGSRQAGNPRANEHFDTKKDPNSGKANNASDSKVLCGDWLKKNLPDYEPGVISHPFRVASKSLVIFTALRVGSASLDGTKWYLGSVIGILDCSDKKKAVLVWKEIVRDKFENKKLQSPESDTIMAAVAQMHRCSAEEVKCRGVHFSASSGFYASYSIMNQGTHEIGVVLSDRDLRTAKVCICCTDSGDKIQTFRDIPLFMA